MTSLSTDVHSSHAHATDTTTHRASISLRHQSCLLRYRNGRHRKPAHISHVLMFTTQSRDPLSSECRRRCVYSSALYRRGLNTSRETNAPYDNHPTVTRKYARSNELGRVHAADVETARGKYALCNPTTTGLTNSTDRASSRVRLPTQQPRKSAIHPSCIRLPPRRICRRSPSHRGWLDVASRCGRIGRRQDRPQR